MSKKENTNQEWLDISNEEYRKYLVITSKGSAEIRILEPKGLKVEAVVIGEGDNAIHDIEHIILDQKGEQHRIPYGWLKISFKEKAIIVEAKK